MATPRRGHRGGGPAAHPRFGRELAWPASSSTWRRRARRRRQLIEKQLRPADHLIRLPHPIVEVAVFEFLALERRKHQRLGRGRRRIRCRVIIGRAPRPHRSERAAPQRAAGWCCFRAQWRQVVEPRTVHASSDG